MGIFSDILLTVDFDRTLTAPDSTIPQRNIDAIHYFIDNGGIFTLNTGRSTNTMGNMLHTIPVNAPFLLYNGSAAYDTVHRKLCNSKIIDMDIWQTMAQVHSAFPEMNLEIQGWDTHYLYHAHDSFVEFYDHLGWGHKKAIPGMDVGPFLKFAIWGIECDPTQGVGQFFSGSEAELRHMDEIEQWIAKQYGDKVVVFRAAPRIIDVHAKGVSKLACARQLQKDLGRKILVCVGDAENDLTMLEGADYAFCPSDGVVANRFPNVCDCGQGAVADVIYKEIPAILKNNP